MSPDSSAVRPSRPSHRYSPYSRPPSGHDAAGDHPEGAEGTHHSASAQYLPPHSATPSTTGCDPVLPGPSSDSPPSASASAHQVEHPMYQDSSSALEHTGFTQHSLPQSTHHFTGNNLYQGPPMLQSIHSLPGFQPLHAAGSSVGIHQENSVYNDYSIERSQGQITTFQGPSVSYNHSQGMVSGSYAIPVSTPQASTSYDSCLFENSIERLDMPVYPGGNQLPLASSPHHQLSNVANHIAAHSTIVHPSSSTQHIAHRIQAPAPHNRSSTQLATPVPLQLHQSQAPIQSQSIGPPQTRIYQGQGMFSGSHHFSLPGENTFIDNSINSDNFMKDFLQRTIIGAEFDSSDRDPPPRCHPGTRLAILKRCLDFIVECNDEGKLRWVVGPAGVGKSAIMQIVTEKAPDGVISASVFLSVNGRRDGTKAVVTIAYQLAVKCALYRQFIRDEIGLDPSLFGKSLSVQFKKFIVEPFMHRRLFDPASRFLVVIDGLDECDKPRVQVNLLDLISDFCIRHPASPIAWIIASRPEPHITSFFERDEVRQAFTKEEIAIDSDEACEDVQRYLRAELSKIKLAYPSLRWKKEWPSEHEFTKIATAAGGLFAYASTVVRYIGDSHYEDPTVQLRHVLETIDGIPQHNMSRKDHPMAQLDALYTRILSDIPDDTMAITRELLLQSHIGEWAEHSFRKVCNIIGLTEGDASRATCHLHAVAKIPEPDQADDESFDYYHKSFEDFLSDFNRSGLFHDLVHESHKLEARSCLRIVEEVPFDPTRVRRGEVIETGHYLIGDLMTGPGFCDRISLSWPGDERFQVTDDELRIDLYKESVFTISALVGNSTSVAQESMFCFNVLTTRFATLGSYFPAVQLRQSVFGEFRHELTELGKLKQVPLRTIDYAAIWGNIESRFTCPIGTDGDFSDSWNESCEHELVALDDLHERQGWHTEFERIIRNDAEETDVSQSGVMTIQECHPKSFLSGDSLPEEDATGCDYCVQRFARHFIGNPDQLATVFIDPTELCYVEFSFVDSDDGVSEWTYRFFHSGRPISVDAF